MGIHQIPYLAIAGSANMIVKIDRPDKMCRHHLPVKRQDFRYYNQRRDCQAVRSNSS